MYKIYSVFDKKKVFFYFVKKYFQMYILKTKGTGKIPNYIQIRDENFVLISHFKAENYKSALKKNGLIKYSEKISEIMPNLKCGELKKIN